MKERGEGGGLDLLGVNVRMFHDVNLEELDVVHVDNKYSNAEKQLYGNFGKQ
ncbi:hypothetical protein E8E11_009009 [Didymella keratinophila]|nr:hypothetical protein E8E11_009009 [Didymella keratinophila]